MTFGLRCYSPACPCIRPRYSFVFLRPRVRFRFFRPAPYGLGLTFRYGWRHRLRRAPFIPLVHNTCQAHERTRPRVWFPAPSPNTFLTAFPEESRAGDPSPQTRTIARAQICFWYELAGFTAHLSVGFAGSGGMAKGLFQAEMRRMRAVQGF